MFLLYRRRRRRRRRRSEQKVTVHCCVSNGMNSAQENSAATYPWNEIERSPLVQGLPRRDWPVRFEMFVAIIICLPVGRCDASSVSVRPQVFRNSGRAPLLGFSSRHFVGRCRRPSRFPSFLPSFLLPSSAPFFVTLARNVHGIARFPRVLFPPFPRNRGHVKGGWKI